MYNSIYMSIFGLMLNVQPFKFFLFLWGGGGRAVIFRNVFIGNSNFLFQVRLGMTA